MTDKRIILRVPAKQRPENEGGGASPGMPTVRATAALTNLPGRGKEINAQSLAPGSKSTISPKDTQPIPLGSPPPPPAPLREFKFLCVFCGKKLVAPERMAGKSTECPECRNVIEVPPPALTPPTPKQQELGVRYRKSPSFKFHCIRCGQGLEAERTMSDTQAFCPVCHSRIAIPRPADE